MSGGCRETVYAYEGLLLQTSNLWEDRAAGQMVRRHEREVGSSHQSRTLTRLTKV